MASANGTQCWKALVSLLSLPLERLPSGTVMGRAMGELMEELMEALVEAQCESGGGWAGQLGPWSWWCWGMKIVIAEGEYIEKAFHNQDMQ